MEHFAVQGMRHPDVESALPFFDADEVVALQAGDRFHADQPLEELEPEGLSHGQELHGPPVLVVEDQQARINRSTSRAEAGSRP